MQGEIFRIIYYHAPSASVAFAFFTVSFVGCVGFLASRRNHVDRAQKFAALALAAAEVGILF
jgi:heme exporter protein C